MNLFVFSFFFWGVAASVISTLVDLQNPLQLRDAFSEPLPRLAEIVHRFRFSSSRTFRSTSTSVRLSDSQFSVNETTDTFVLDHKVQCQTVFLEVFRRFAGAVFESVISIRTYRHLK
jgi:hypothetical protein